jgi:PAS domain S-box-containing protein
MRPFIFSQLLPIKLFLACLTLNLCCMPTSIQASPISEKPLIISMDRAYSPFTVVSPTGEPAGLFVEMWQLWSKQTGVPVEFLVEDWPGSIQALREGRADVHSGLFVNERRAQWMAFSQPIHEIKTSLYFQTEKEAGVPIEEMAGKKVGVLEGTYQLQYLSDYHKNIRSVSYPDGRALIMALLTGEVNAILNENVMVEADLASFGIRGLLKQSTQIAFSNHVVAAVRKDRQNLLPVINDGFDVFPIGRMVKLEERWLSNPADRYYERLLLAKEFTLEEKDWIRKNPAVKVAVTNYMAPVDIVEKDGSYKGLSPAFLSLLSERTGLEFVPVFKSKWSDVVQAIMSGETDIALSLSRTPKREKKVLFTDPYAFIPQMAIVRRDYNKVSKWADLSDKRVAVTQGAAIIEDLKKIIGEKGALILTKNFYESLERVTKGEADALVAGLIRYRRVQSERSMKDLKIAARYVTEGGSFRIGIHKSKPLLAEILNKGLRRIGHQELVDIRDRWLTLEETEGPALTPEERAWIEQRKTPVIVGAEMDWPPFDFVKDGNPTGYSNDLLRIAAQKVGLPLTFVSDLTWAQLVEKFKQGEIDVLPAVYKTPAREREMALTRSYTANPSVLVGHEKKPDIRSFEDLVDKKLAVVEGFSINKVIEEKHPNIEQIPFTNVLEALKAVSLEKADAFVGSFGVISHILKENLIPEIRVVDEVSLESPEATYLHMATLKGQAVLRDIIQKGLDAITEAELNELRTTWLGLGLIEKRSPNVKLTDEEKAWIKANPVVKVASTPDWPPFEYVDSDGKYRGITVDVLRLIAERVGLETEIVLKPWNENAPKLKSGELDICPALRKTPERTKYLLFTSPYISSQDAIWVKKDRNDINSIKDFPGKTIAVEEDYYQQEYLEDNHPDVRLFLVPNTLEALKAVSMERADIYMGTLAVGAYLIEQHMLTDLKIVGYFEDRRMELAIGMHAGKPLLRNILQKGQDSISDKELNEIKQKYLTSDAPKSLFLTDQERQWLETHKNIRLGVDPSWFPFEGFGSDGRYMGIVSEYVNWLNEKLGLSMTPVEGLSWQEVISEARTGGIDVLPGVGVTPSRKEYLNFTRSYLRIPIVLVTREDMPFVSGLEGLAGKRVAIIANAPMGEKLQAEHPELRYLKTKNLVEALQAVANGDADATLGNNASLTYYVRRNDIKGLKVIASLPQTLDLSFGVRKDWQPLVSILNKALAAIPEAEHRSFRDRWVNIQVQSRIDWKSVIGISLAILLVAGTVLAFIVRANRKLAHEVHERTLAEQKMRAMSEAVHDALALIDAKARIMYWNHAAESMFNLSASEVMGRDLHALIIPEELHEQARSGLKAFAQSGHGPVVGKLQVVNAVRSDGSVFPAEVAVSGFKVGNDWHAVGTVRDITERKQAEEALKNSQMQLAQIFDFLPDPTMVIDNAGRVIAWNKAMEEISGIKAEYMLGQGDYKYGVPFYGEARPMLIDLAQKWDASYQEKYLEIEQLEGGALLAESFHPNMKGGTYLSGKARQLFDAEGNPNGAIESIRDITDRIEAEKRLRESQSRLDMALTASNTGMWDWRPIDGVDYHNDQWYAQLGYTREEFSDDANVLMDLMHPDDAVRFKNFMDEYAHNDSDDYAQEFRMRAKDGSWKWILSIGRVIERDDAGRKTRIVGVHLDLTERKKAELELREARREAEAATQAKSDFLANMSHEIRTPMNAIIGMSHLALKTDLDPKQHDYLIKIDQSAKSLLGIINDILDFSKIEAGKLDMESIDFSLGEVLDNLSNLVSMKTQEKGLEFVFAVDPEVPFYLIGDPLRLGQILLNLTSNALKFTEQGEIVVSVKALDVEPESTFLRFAVKDTGIGLGEEQRAKLFQSFQQADTSTTRKFGGTGLGLTISKKLTELMGGQIGVDSEPGVGSTFYFTARFGRQIKEKRRLTVVPETLKDLSVLVVDDNETMRLVLQQYLEEFSFQVDECASGIQALEVVQEKKSADGEGFDLILLDWQMPGMDGIETARKILNDSDIAKTPKIIVVTGHGRADVMQRTEDLELDGFLLKPVTQSLLFNTIMEAFGHATEGPSSVDRRKEVRPEGFEAVRGAHILLVEDNEINQQVATELLKDEGFFMDIADNGKIAVEKIMSSINQMPYDVVLMDLQMPVMDGYTAAQEIRKDTRFDDLPVVAMTADAMSGVREKVLDIGMNDYVTKPIDPAELFRTLVKWVLPADRELPPEYTVADADALESDESLIFEKLEGINVSEGLARVGGKSTSYRKLLQKFSVSNTQVVDDITRALSEGNIDLAERTAHTLKGVSGNIGATDLHKAAIALDDALKNENTEGLEPILEQVSSALCVVLSSIQGIVSKEEKERTDAKGVMDVTKVTELLGTLRDLLDDYDAKAVEVLDQVQRQITGIEAAPILKQLASQISSYDYDEALESLDALAQTLKIDWSNN